MIDKENIGSVLSTAVKDTYNRLVFEVCTFSFHVNRVTEIRSVRLENYIYVIFLMVHK